MTLTQRVFAAAIAVFAVVAFAFRDCAGDAGDAPPLGQGADPARLSGGDVSGAPTNGRDAEAMQPPLVAPPRAEVPADRPQSPNLVRLRLRLVDEETRAPVPLYSLALTSMGQRLELLTSDEQGIVTGAGEFAPGKYEFDLSIERSPNDLIQAKRKGEAAVFPKTAEWLIAPAEANLEPPELAIPLGPTLEFVAPWPAGLSAERFSAQLSSADPRQAWDKLYARLRPAAMPWARFSPLARFLSGGPPWGVRVSSDDGLWLAIGTVESLSKRDLAPIALQFSARGRVVGRVLDTEDAPIVKTWVQAWLPDSSFDNPNRRPTLVLTDGEGRFDLRTLEPGTYTLRVQADGFDPLADEVEVAALATVERDLRVTRPDPSTLGAIRGRITSFSGSYVGPLRVRLRANFPPYAARYLDAKWLGETGAREASFEFEAMTEGEYTLEVTPQDLVAVDPGPVLTRPSQEWLEFRIDDRGERIDLPVRVVADEDGSPLTAFRIDVDTVGGKGARATFKAGKDESTAWLRGAVVGSTLALTVYAQPDRQILWHEINVERSEQPLELRVKAGWGAKVIVRGPADELLSGVRISFDGEDVGASDDAGELRVGLPRLPTVLSAQFGDWVLDVGGDVLADTGRFPLEMPYLRVRMRPPQEPRR